MNTCGEFSIVAFKGVEISDDIVVWSGSREQFRPILDGMLKDIGADLHSDRAIMAVFPWWFYHPMQFRFVYGTEFSTEMLRWIGRVMLETGSAEWKKTGLFLTKVDKFTNGALVSRSAKPVNFYVKAESKKKGDK